MPPGYGSSSRDVAIARSEVPVAVDCTVTLLCGSPSIVNISEH